MLMFVAFTFVSSNAYAAAEVSRACQMDAKICPDGSSVTRTGPNCTFPRCPPVARACQMDAKICPDGSSVTRTGPNCTFPRCPKVCNAIRCEAGYVTVFDKFGCPKRCVRKRIKECPMIRCAPGYVTQIGPDGCGECVTGPVSQPTDCQSQSILCSEGSIPEPGTKCPTRCVPEESKKSNVIIRKKDR